MNREMHEKWMCSIDEERWQATEYFETKEEARIVADNFGGEVEEVAE